jgi:hypothetical protein
MRHHKVYFLASLLKLSLTTLTADTYISLAEVNRLREGFHHPTWQPQNSLQIETLV